MISILWIFFIIVSIIIGILSGSMAEVSLSINEGATSALNLIIKIAPMMALWSGIMEVISKSGLASKISRFIMPALRGLFGKDSQNEDAMNLVAGNITANILGLSNAATPIGLLAADKLYEINGRRGTPHSLIMFVVINTASLQLVPTTVGALRASLGSKTPFDIIPAAWGASIISVLVAIISAKIFARIDKV